MTSFTDEVFAGQKLSRLYRLVVSGNSIEHLNMTVFKHTPNLESLQVSHNRIVRITPHVMLKLTVLQMSNNALFNLLMSCMGNGTSLFPKLVKLSFSDKFSSFTEEVTCFTVLMRLDLSRNSIEVLAKDMFGERPFPQLNILTLHAIQHIKRIDRFAFRSRTLQSLSLMFSNIPVHAFYVDADCFAGNPGLQSLQLSHNFLNAPESKFRQLFSPLQSLRKLYIGSCFIDRITENMLSSLGNLSTLGLYGNKISYLPVDVFDSLTRLKRLNLSGNKLRTVSLRAISLATRN